ncbi:hypothetical protein CPT_Mulock_061 [Klebsiella phage Mulock]|nr:hypothetical protein CPT_Mulock_061 [Klebsiella phage Mulock]
MNTNLYLRYQIESVVRANMPAVKRHSKPVKTTQQKQPTGAAA